jgi:hypothetical protein
MVKPALRAEEIIELEREQTRQELQSADEFLIEQEPEPSDVSLMNALAEIGGSDVEATVSVYRASSEKGLKGGAWLTSCAASEFSLEMLRDNYGGGTYRIHIKKDGRIVKGGNRLITIEEAKKPVATFVPQQPAPDFMKFAEVMQSGFSRLGELIVQMNQAPRVDSNQMRRDMMADMLTMKEIFGVGHAPQQNNGEQAINMLMKGLELAREITPREGEAGTADIIMEALKTFGKPIAEVAMSRAVQAQEPIPALARAREPAENFTPAPAPEQPQANEETMLKMYAAMLADKAAQDSDPAIYAGLVVDNMPEEQLRALIDRPDLMQFLGSLSPKLVQYPEWVNEFISVIREMLTDEEIPASVQENQAGSVPDANNGGSEPA